MIFLGAFNIAWEDFLMVFKDYEIPKYCYVTGFAIPKIVVRVNTHERTVTVKDVAADDTETWDVPYDDIIFDYGDMSLEGIVQFRTWYKIPFPTQPDSAKYNRVVIKKPDTTKYPTAIFFMRFLGMYDMQATMHIDRSHDDRMPYVLTPYTVTFHHYEHRGSSGEDVEFTNVFHFGEDYLRTTLETLEKTALTNGCLRGGACSEMEYEVSHFNGIMNLSIYPSNKDDMSLHFIARETSNFYRVLMAIEEAIGKEDTRHE